LLASLSSPSKQSAQKRENIKIKLIIHEAVETVNNAWGHAWRGNEINNLPGDHPSVTQKLFCPFSKKVLRKTTRKVSSTPSQLFVHLSLSFCFFLSFAIAFAHCCGRLSVNINKHTAV
jgi:hypothetical protein